MPGHEYPMRMRDGAHCSERYELEYLSEHVPRLPNLTFDLAA
jgi:hypothetical protein